MRTGYCKRLRRLNQQKVHIVPQAQITRSLPLPLSRACLTGNVDLYGIKLWSGVLEFHI